MSDAIILQTPHTQEIRESPALGDDRPTEILKEPVMYAWKPILKEGQYRHPTHGYLLNITADRLRKIDRSTKQYLANGNRPFVPVKHQDYSADDNLGWLMETKVEGDTLYGLHQLIGERARKAAAANDSSVCLKLNFKDANGNVYPEVLTHNALCPDPVATGLGGFVALSASSPDDAAPIYTLAITERSQAMPLTAEQLTKTRQILGADVSEDTAIDKLIAAVEAAKPKDGTVQMSLSDKTKLESDLVAAQQRANNAEGQVAELSRSSGKAKASPDVLQVLAESRFDRIDKRLESGQINAEQAKRLKALVHPDNGQPNEIMLSRSGSGPTLVDQILEVIDAGPSMKTLTGEQTGGQSGDIRMSLHDDKKDKDKQPMTDERRNYVAQSMGITLPEAKSA